MRKINATVSALIMLLFLLHAVAGAFQLAGIIPGGMKAIQGMAWLLVLLLVVHVIIGAVLTIQSIRISRKAGVFYWRENQQFWIRRISGFALMALIFYHLLIFGQINSGGFRLHDFGTAELVGHILLVLSLVVHVLSNIKPLMLSFGAYGIRAYFKDILFVLSVVLLVAAVSFVIYYLRWNVWWRGM